MVTSASPGPTRRNLIAAAGSALAAPALGAATRARTLRFVPQSDLAILDPIATTNYVTRNHALMVFDTLYGVDAQNRPQLQMLAGHAVERDGLEWVLTLREGLRFHDGEPVLARDVVASLRRWGKQDNVGRALMATTDELSAVSDRAVRFRLRRPFPFLPSGLGKEGTNICAIMPERLAAGEPLVQVQEMVGSGPYRFVAGERLPGARAVYERFEGYVPRPDGMASALAGPKVAHFDRVEWLVLPDASTAASALSNGEVDWWEEPGADQLEMLARNRNVAVTRIDPYGSAGVIRFNFLHAPGNDQAFRRACMAAISQTDVMTAIAGDEKDRWSAGVGYFLPGTAMASDAGLEAMRDPPDLVAARRMLAQSGYGGETLVFLVPADQPGIKAQNLVVADALQKIGVRLDVQTADWGTVSARHTNRQDRTRGGWDITGTFTAGVGLLNPASNNFLRGSGASAIYGWADIPRLEALRTAWFEASNEAAQVAICRELQQVAFETVPYVPTGLLRSRTVHRRDIVGLLQGPPLFWGVRRAG